MYSVNGEPAPQGSKTLTKYGMRDASKKLKPWRAAVHEASQEQADLTDMITGPVVVTLRFNFTRPAKPVRDYPPTDIDKLCRAVLDGMTTGGIIEDDKHVIALHATKHYNEYPGVIIIIDTLNSY